MFVGRNIFPCTNFLYFLPLYLGIAFTCQFFRNLHPTCYLMLFYLRLYVSVIASFLCHCLCWLINTALQAYYIVSKESYVFHINIHYCHNCRYKSYITSLPGMPLLTTPIFDHSRSKFFDQFLICVNLY